MKNLRSEFCDLLADLERRGIEIKADPTDSRAFIISPGDKLTPADRQAIDAHPRELLLVLHESELNQGIEVLARLQRCRSYTLPRGRLVEGPDGQYVGGEAKLSQERATTEQSLALKVINPEQAAEEEQAQDDKIFGLRENLYKQLAALYPADSKEAERANAEEAQAESEYATKRIEDATKIEVANKAAATSMAEAWRGALEPLMSSFDSFFDLIVQGTNKAKGSAEQMRLEMEKLERSTLLDLAKSGMKGVMFGGKEGTTQGAFFGGGMVGEASQLAMGTGGSAGGAGGAGNAGILGWLLGPSQANAMMSAMKGTGGNSGGLLGWLFGTASSAIMGAMGMAPGGAAAGAPGAKPAAPTEGIGGGIAGSVASSAAGSVSSNLIGDAMKPLQAPLTKLAGQGEQQIAHLAMLAVTSSGQLVQSIMHTTYLELIAAWDEIISIYDAIIAATSGFEAGGIVSAAGGMVVGGGAYGAIPALLHAREMVLPRYLSEGFQRMLGQGDSSGGGEIHVHTHIHAVDAKSFEERLDHHSNAIANGVVKAMRMQHPGLTHAIKTGHAGR